MPRAACIYTVKESHYNDPFRSGTVVLTTIAASNHKIIIVIVLEALPIIMLLIAK